jgi:hypothetical protein
MMPAINPVAGLSMYILGPVSGQFANGHHVHRGKRQSRLGVRFQVQIVISRAVWEEGSCSQDAYVHAGTVEAVEGTS